MAHPLPIADQERVRAPAAGRAAPQCDREKVKALFIITGRADPEFLSAVIAPVARLKAVPLRVHATCESGDGSELTIDLRLAGVTAELARDLELALRAVAGVAQVFAVVEPLAGRP